MKKLAVVLLSTALLIGCGSSSVRATGNMFDRHPIDADHSILVDRELLESITFPDMSMERKVMQEIRESGQRKKPPFGTVPNWLVLPKRIADLSGAIIRFAESDQMNTDAVREWAQEIICHCNTMDELKKVKAPVSNAGKINRADPA